MVIEKLKFLIENELISSSQSGFEQGDSCINQLVSAIHDIYKSFGESHDIRGVFLDISKAFDKVWHDVINFKITQYGISWNLLNLLRNFLNERRQFVVLNALFSTGTGGVTAEVPQSFILRTLKFSIYINYLSEGLSTNAKLFADNSCLSYVIHDSQTSVNNLNKDLEIIHNWDCYGK